MPTPPLLPDSEEAREWAREELSRSVYSTAPSLWERLREWLADLLETLAGYGGGLDVAFLPVVIVLVGAAAILFAALYGNSRRRGALAPAGAVWAGDDRRSAAELRAAAGAARDAGDYARAAVEMFRAIVRAAEERGEVEASAGMTAVEVARALAAQFPDHHPGLQAAAGVFNEAMYGRGHAEPADVEHLTHLDAALAAGAGAPRVT